MPSLISQLRNGIPQQAPAQQQQLPIQQVKDMMQQLRSASNPQQALMSMIQSNPNFSRITEMMKSSHSNLETLAKQMAQQRGIDLNNLINELIK